MQSLAYAGAALTCSSVFGAGDSKIETRKLTFGIPPGAAGTKLALALLAEMGRAGTERYELEHVLGLGGRKSVTEVVGSPPNGNRILHTQSALITVFPHVYRESLYDPLRDLTPICTLSEYAYVLLINDQVPAEITTLASFLRWSQQNYDSRQIGVTLKGSQAWLIAKTISIQAEANFMILNYTGTAPIIADLLDHNLTAAVVVTGNGKDAIRNGRLRAIAVSSADRWIGLPEVLTLEEAGFKDLVIGGWYGWFGPAGLPPDLANRIRGNVNDAMQTAAMQKTLVDLDMVRLDLDQRQIKERIEREGEYYEKIISASQLERL